MENIANNSNKIRTKKLKDFLKYSTNEIRIFSFPYFTVQHKCAYEVT